MYDGTPRPLFSPPSFPSAPRRRSGRTAAPARRTAAPARRTAAPARRAAALAVVLSATLLAGCGTTKGDAGDAKPAASSAKGFPVTVDNCGTRTTYRKPPARVVTIHQHPAELLLALGLKDRMVGTAYPDSGVLPELKKDFEAVPELAKKEPSFETVLNAEPDFVYGGYGSAFAEKAGRSRKAFADAGIDTYLNREYCGKKKQVSVADNYDEIRTIGAIFGVPERAGKLVGDLRARVGRTTEAVKGAPAVPVFVYDSGDKAAFTAGGKGLGSEIIRLAGGRNVFADLDGVFGDVSWEQVVARKPEVIAIYDYGGAGNVERKKEFLLSQPALADVPAVKNKRFVVVPLTDTVVGIRPPYAVEKLARELHPERFR